jgi:hypothetical protein
LRQVDPLGRLGKAAAIDHRNEGPRQIQIEAEGHLHFTEGDNDI